MDCQSPGFRWTFQHCDTLINMLGPRSFLQH